MTMSPTRAAALACLLCIVAAASAQTTVRMAQVNVDSNQQNIAKDAGNEPSIAVDPTNPARIAIGWRQFNSVSSDFRQAGYGWSDDGGHTWTFPGVLENNVFRSDPVLDSDVDGKFYYYSLTIEQGVYRDYMFLSSDGGQTWAKPVKAAGGDKPWMIVDRTDSEGQGNIYAHWTHYYSCCGTTSFVRSTDGGATFENPLDVDANPYWGTLAVGPEGELYIFGASDDRGAYVIVRSDDARDAASTPTFDLIAEIKTSDAGQIVSFTGPNPDGLCGQGWIAADTSDGPNRGNVYWLWSLKPPSGAHPIDVRFSRSTDGGQTWSKPITINDDADGNGAWHWFGTLSIAPNGRLDAVWNDTRNTGKSNKSELFYSYSTDGGETWSVNEKLSSVWDSLLGWPQQRKIGDYYHMVSDNAGINLAWSATFNKEQDVYFLRTGRLGDVNCDGAIDFNDIDAFVTALIDADTYDQAYPNCNLLNADINGDSAVNFNDIDGFVECLINNGCP